MIFRKSDDECRLYVQKNSNQYKDVHNFNGVSKSKKKFLLFFEVFPHFFFYQNSISQFKLKWESFLDRNGEIVKVLIDMQWSACGFSSSRHTRCKKMRWMLECLWMAREGFTVLNYLDFNFLFLKIVFNGFCIKTFMLHTLHEQWINRLKLSGIQ